MLRQMFQVKMIYLRPRRDADYVGKRFVELRLFMRLDVRSIRPSVLGAPAALQSSIRHRVSD